MAALRWGIAVLACAPALAQDRCACPDGRIFSLGAAMFGQNSTRVIVAGFEPELPASAMLPRCSAIQALGQTVELHRSPDGRVYLKRENRKRGVIRDICRTQIRFIQSAKSYDFFADDGNAVTLDGATPVDTAPAPADPPEDLSPDLTGKDLLLFDSRSRPLNPAAAGFDQEDLKETAYVIVRKRVKASVYSDRGTAAGEVSVGAGLLGRIEKRAGNRSEPLWAVDLFPDSAPAPFWRTLAASLRRTSPASNRVILASSQLVEINHFLDRYHIETTRFADSRRAPDPGTMDLPAIFAPRKLPLEENIAEARASGSLARIQAELARLALVPKVRQNGLVILDESGEAPRANLLRRQCFIETNAAGERLNVTDAAVKIFRPRATPAAPDYYAVDLQMSLRSAANQARVVCRFPFEAIDVSLVDRARRILSGKFKIEP
ncbi:MAG TPA: hypothetical protein VKX39_04350 [Bryobacteraceae bacterium]|nr:hypothetical protein [Bryobacteraceae bacterium]